MRVLDPEVVKAVWTTVEALIPPREESQHYALTPESSMCTRPTTFNHKRHAPSAPPPV